MISFKRRSAFIAGVAALVLSQMVGSLAAPVCPNPSGIANVSPDFIDGFLKMWSIDTADKFLACLPPEYKENWIMMSYSESSQVGTAEYPRFILTSKDSTNVLGFELPSNPSPTTKESSNTIEYIHFDPVNNKFGFHSIITNEKRVVPDDPKCPVCHRANLRPNWDAYDSWAGMLPFNRDRVYQQALVKGLGPEESVESKAIRRIFKKLKIDRDPLFAQLTLPDGIRQDATTGEVTIAFDCDQSCFNDPGDGGMRPVEYGFDTDGHVVYPGDLQTTVQQGGKYLRFNSTSKPVGSNEGRGVALFDNFTGGIPMNTAMPAGPNPRRVAQTLLDYVKDDNTAVDVRYVALAIAKGCVTEKTLGKFAPKEELVKLLAYHKVTDFASLLADTNVRRRSLPQLKANLESLNLEDLISADGDQDQFATDRVNANIARRSTEGGKFNLDSNLGWMIDREADRGYENENPPIALFRLFLEPLPTNKQGIKLLVNEWSMAIPRHLTTYTFGDQFNQYVLQLATTLQESLKAEGHNVECSDLAAGSIKTFSAAPNKTPPPPAESIDIPLTGIVHLQDLGDRPLRNAEWAGTKDQERRLEGFSVDFSIPIQGVDIEYTCHLQGIGDQPWMAGGTFCGTRGQSRRLEGFAIRLSGINADEFDVFYSCLVQDIGDAGPFKNGAFCGTRRGQSKRVEAIEVWVTPKSSVGLQGIVYLEGTGDVPFTEDMFAGTRGESRRLEGFSVELSQAIPDLGMEYMCHLEGVGDTAWMQGGQFCGSRGQSRRLEGIAVRLTGPAANMYDVYYLCHLHDIGDTGPVYDGALCGTRGLSRQLEGLYIWISNRLDL